MGESSMKLIFKNETLIITPETPQEEEQIAALTGGFSERDGRRKAEAKNQYGSDVTLADDGISVEFGIGKVWWNYDD
jgi:hypothetical protein